MICQYKIRVHGRVQGVGFRYAARNQARSLSLKGWVENCSDGTVVSVFKGPRNECLKFIEWCRRGTAYSWVEKLEIDEMEPEQLPPFSLKY